MKIESRTQSFAQSIVFAPQLEPIGDPMRLLAFAFALSCAPAIASAAIAPVHYQNAQQSAPDLVTIKVLSVDTSVCLLTCRSQTVTVKAKVEAVARTKSGLKVGQTITIVYEHRPLKGRSGPSPIRVLTKGETTPAYLRVETDTKGARTWTTAARKASFEAPIK